MSETWGERAPVERSQRLLRAARLGEDDTVAACWTALAEWNADELASQLSDDDARTAFWLNVYNAAVQDQLRSDPSRYESRLRFFVGNRVSVAGHDLSLNDIEHGILRRSRSVFFLGYGPRIFQDRFERTHRVDALDPRIHFALNCGAASCPAVRYYDPDRVDDQLDLAAETYLRETVEYDPASGVARLPRLFLWHHGDFADPVGLCRRYGALPADADPTVRYRSWDWTRAAGKFA